MMRKFLCSTGLSWLWLAALVCSLDIIIKFEVISKFQLYESVDLIPFFKLTYAQNIGAAFSAMSGQRVLLVLVAIIISAFLIIVLYRSPSSAKLNNISLNLIIGGALGNMFDRLYHGYVIDYFHFFIGEWSFPIFNLADVAICVGAGLLILDSLLLARKGKQQTKLDDKDQ